MAEGVVQGPTHEQGGVEARDKQGNVRATVEGGERLFSVEDTQEIEKFVSLIGKSEEDNANQLAMELGYKVVKMVNSQEERRETPTDDEFLAKGGDEDFDEPNEYID